MCLRDKVKAAVGPQVDLALDNTFIMLCSAGVSGLPLSGL